MVNDIKKYLEELQSFEIKDEKQLDQFRLKYLSKKGLIQKLFLELKNVPNDKKRNLGQEINNLKILANEIYDSLKDKFSSKSVTHKYEDFSKPSQIL